MPAEDLWVYQAIGKKGTELTGYPAISVYHDFRYHPKSVIGATFLWAFDHLGIFSWVVEIWSPMREAGIENYKYIDWFRDHPPEDDLKLLRWSDTALGGLAHIPWKAFDHPQLGKVEIGGWNRFHAFSNPPPAFLERELARFPKWLIWNAMISPKLELVHAGAEDAGGGNYKVSLVVQNTGWLPSYVSKRALERKIVRGLVAEIALPQGATLVQGKRRIDAGQLEGKAYKHTGVSFWPDLNVTDDRVKVEWIVRAKAVTRSTSWRGTSGQGRYASRSSLVESSVEGAVMAKVLGVGGVFFKSPDAAALRAWYSKWLGVPAGEYGAMFSPEAMPPGGMTIWNPFASTTDYFSPSKAPFMINLIVDNLDGAVAQVREGGALVVKTEDSDYGRLAGSSIPMATKSNCGNRRRPRRRAYESGHGCCNALRGEGEHCAADRAAGGLRDARHDRAQGECRAHRAHRCHLRRKSQLRQPVRSVSGRQRHRQCRAGLVHAGRS